MSSDPSNIPLQLQFIIIAVMVAVNGLVVLTNTAMNTANRSKVRQLAEADERAARLIVILERPTDYRFTNRLLSYIFVAVGLFFAIRLPYDDILSLIAFVAASVIFGEYFTRKIAQQHSEAVAMAMTSIERFFLIALKPLVALLTLIANLFLKLFRQETDIQNSGYSEDKVMSILEAGQQSGEIKEEGKKMINSIFQFDDELAYEIMTPRTDVFLIDINDPAEEYLDELMELRYSRIPVCEDDTDNVIGILHIKVT